MAQRQREQQVQEVQQSLHEEEEVAGGPLLVEKLEVTHNNPTFYG